MKTPNIPICVTAYDYINERLKKGIITKTNIGAVYASCFAYNDLEFVTKNGWWGSKTQSTYIVKYKGKEIKSDSNYNVMLCLFMVLHIKLINK